jgi:hypothetical protein
MEVSMESGNEAKYCEGNPMDEIYEARTSVGR